MNLSITPAPVHESDNRVSRYEMKYVVDVRLKDSIRDFLLNFCQRDPHLDPRTGEYTVSTLFFDTWRRDFYLWNESKAVNRFKLRARCYGPAATSPLFLEVKRRVGEVVDKSRAAIAAGWTDIREIIRGQRLPEGLAPSQRVAFYEFERAFRLMAVNPVLRVRYERESFIGENDAYARVTFDRRIRYQAARDWSLPGGARWRSMDGALATGRNYPSFILELKCTADQPAWMAELMERFNLVRTDFCKFATATRLELLHQGFAFSDASENCTF